MSIYSIGQPVDDPYNTFDEYTLKTNNVKTPEGTNIESKDYEYSIYNGIVYYDWSSELLEDFIEEFENNPLNSNKEIIGDATKTYNCHSYAWNTCEGGNYVHWINARLNSQSSGNGNIVKYWGTNGGYSEVSNISTADKIYYSDDDHSASIISASTGMVISKWGNWLLIEHPYLDCPYPNLTNLKYYKLSNPTISSTTSGALCNNVQRTYSSDIVETNFTYNWNYTSPLDEISDDDGSTYTVKGTSQNGLGTVSLMVTTPSGATATATKPVWVGAPAISSLMVRKVLPITIGLIIRHNWKAAFRHQPITIGL
ncbi:MAG: hypothetical protein HQ522_17130 [Bacteroidetes bacterium]|nr:hypothetical protein [Bacteroidota bacterium]